MLRRVAGFLARKSRSLILRWNNAALRPLFESGEKLLAFIVTQDGNIWSASNRAIYIEYTKHSSRSRRKPNQRIPYLDMASVVEVPVPGRLVTRSIYLRPREGGQFYREPGVANKDFKDAVDGALSAITSERKEIEYEGGWLKFACRKIGDGVAAAWILEDVSLDLQPISESTAASITRCLELLNSRSL